MTDATTTSKPANTSTPEVQEETRETLAVVDQVRKPRPEKMASERAFFDGAHEVRFSERSFRPRHDASLDDVRAFVDSLVVERRSMPALPEPPAPAPVVVEQRIPDHYRLALEPVVHGSLVKVETVHRVGTGTVVDVEWEGRDEATHKGLYVIEDGVARRYDDVAARIDELPGPVVDAPAPEPAPAPAPATAAASAEAAQPPAKDEKKRFGFGKKEKPKDKTKAAEAAAAEPATPAERAAPAPAEAPAEEPKKKRFGFGRK